MDRRDFLKSASVTGVLSLLPLAQLARAEHRRAARRGSPLGDATDRLEPERVAQTPELVEGGLDLRRGQTRKLDADEYGARPVAFGKCE